MYLDERSNLILKTVLSNPSISNAELEKSFSLTRRQISYSFAKINDWLAEKNYPKIKRTHSGKFIVSPNLRTLFNEKEALEQKSTQYIPSEKERVQFIALMLLSRDEELSLIHFSSALEVSKNTALRDIKAVQKWIESYQLEITYSRVQGYHMVGNEWDKRKLLIDVLYALFNIYNGEWYIRKLSKTPYAEIKKLKQRIEEVESRLQLSFIDERIKHLPYVMAILRKRIQRGHVINKINHIDYAALSDTKEFEAAAILIEDNPDIPEQERLFITLKLLTSNIFSAHALTEEEFAQSQLKKSLLDCLDLFEKKAAITFQDKAALLNRLYLHMKPAYYRIKYNLTTNYSVLQQIGHEFKAIHYIVKDSIKPFQDFIGCEVPESEIMFVTILIGGHLIESGATIPVKKKAIVVCPNGISISQLMEHTLRDLFPEFYFYRAFSIREFERLDMEYDIVFSNVPIRTDKHLFIINQFLSDFDKVQLRQRVMRGIFGLVDTVVNIDNIITVIEKHAKIQDKPGLENALQDYFSQKPVSEDKTTLKTESTLADFITPETIVIKDSVDGWHDALICAAQPLLENGSISESYLETMVKQYPTLSPHILLRMNVAIPHARPQDGVHSVGMTLLKIKNGLPLEDGRKLHLIVVIAAVDKNKHLNALLQLMKMADKDEIIQQLVQLNDPDEIYQVIQEYSG